MGFFSLPLPNLKKMLSIETKSINSIFNLKAELVSNRGEVTEGLEIGFESSRSPASSQVDGVE